LFFVCVGSSSTFNTVNDEQCEGVGNVNPDCLDFLSKNIMKSNLSEEINNIMTEKTLDNSVVEKVNINQTKDVLFNNVLFKRSIFERLNKMENNLKGTNKILQEILSFQKTEHTRLETLLESQISFLENFVVMNNFKQSNAKT